LSTICQRFVNNARNVTIAYKPLSLLMI